MAEFVTPQYVRDFMQATGTTGQWSNSLIGSNIAAASARLQRWTRRQFEPQGSNTAVTKVFSTHGASGIHIPDVRSVTSVVLNDATLTADETYYLLPDRNNSGVYVGIEFPGQRDRWYPGLNTFDINYNHLRWRGNVYDTLPNNLAITSSAWGHVPYPDELLHATAAGAAFLTLRPDALLSGARQTPEGNIFDLSRWPLEVQAFVDEWRIEDSVAVASG